MYDLTKTIQERRQRWFGHVQRMDSERFPRKAMKLGATGTRKRGRPRTTWRSTVAKDLTAGGVTWEEAEELTQDRTE